MVHAILVCMYNPSTCRPPSIEYAAHPSAPLAICTLLQSVSFTIDRSLSLASLVCMFQHSSFSSEVDCLNLCSSECLHLPFAIFNSWDFPCVHVLVPGLRVLCMYTRQHRTTRPWEPESRNQVLGRFHLCLPLPGPIAPDRRMRARRNPAATEPLVEYVYEIWSMVE